LQFWATESKESVEARMRRATFALIVLVGSYIGSGTASGEPVLSSSALRITSGSGSILWGSDDTVFALSGAGESFELFVEVDLEHHAFPGKVVGPFALDPSTSGIGPVLFGNIRIGERALTIEAFSDLTFGISAPIVPFGLPDPTGDAVFVPFYPFTFTASLTASGEELTFIGNGRGDADLFVFPDGSGDMFNQGLTFEGTAPVPEPGTMLLLSIGAIAGLTRWTRA
jgi:hypothetical protein